MRRLLGLVLGLALLASPVIAGNTTLPNFQPGPRLIDGTALNFLIAAENGNVFGETALDGSNPTPVATGLTSITSCQVSIKLATAPGVGTSVVTYSTTAGTLNLYGWKVTASGDATLIASTGTETIGWACQGTR